jgi:ABC-type transport system substrate-binding protein
MKAEMANQANGDLGNAWLRSHTTGVAAYKLTEWATSDHVIIDANPHATEKGLMRRIVLRQVSDPVAQLLLLQMGDVDIARELGSNQLKTIARDKNLTVSPAPQGRRCISRCIKRSHFVDKELTSQSQAAVHELDPAKRMALYRSLQEAFRDRAPFAMLLQRNAVAVLGKGVSGFKVGPMPDYTHYTSIAKA